MDLETNITIEGSIELVLEVESNIEFSNIFADFKVRDSKLKIDFKLSFSKTLSILLSS